MREGWCYCGQEVDGFRIYIFSAIKEERVCPILQSRNMLFISADCCVHCRAKLVL